MLWLDSLVGCLVFFELMPCALQGSDGHLNVCGLEKALVGCLGAAAHCLIVKINGIYTSMVFRRNECCSHVRRAVVLETDSFYWARRFFIMMQY